MRRTWRRMGGNEFQGGSFSFSEVLGLTSTKICWQQHLCKFWRSQQAYGYINTVKCLPFRSVIWLYLWSFSVQFEWFRVWKRGSNGVVCGYFFCNQLDSRYAYFGVVFLVWFFLRFEDNIGLEVNTGTVTERINQTKTARPASSESVWPGIQKFVFKYTSRRRYR